MINIKSKREIDLLKEEQKIMKSGALKKIFSQD